MSNLDTFDTGVVRILHVDDDETFLILVKEILQAENKFEIGTASSAVEAIKKLESEEYDVIVSDYEMPHEDGLHFLKKLREQKNQTPFILFTGKGREEVAIKALNLGADYYLNKHGSTEVVFGELAHAIISSARSKYAELKIKESQEIYRASFEGAMDAIMLLDEKGFLDCNKTTLSLFGFTTVNDFANRHPADLSPLNQPDGSSSRTKAMDHIIKAFETGMDRFFWIHKRLDNTTFLADVLLMRLQIQGRYVLQATVRDVTKQKDFETALIESEARLKAYLNSIAAGIFVIDSESHIILEANEAAKKMFGDSKTPLVGSLCYNFICADKKYACPITDLGQAVDHSERTLLKANGEHLPILKTVVPITLNGRKLLIESFVDITNLKEAEKSSSFK